MTTNIWQRSVSKTLLRIVQEIGATSPLAFREINLTPIIDAAEDAEREGQHECPTDIGVTANCPQCECVPYEKQCAYHADARLRPPETPAPSLPPLDPALVEECARAGRLGFYTDTGDGDRSCAAWESISPGSREEWQACAASALTHYRERVERSLREEIASHQCWPREWAAASRTLTDALAEADRLRGELESEKVASRRYADSTDTAIACGSHDDPTAGNCGECRACVVAERDRLRRELADVRDVMGKWQAKCSRLTADLNDALAKLAPQPTDEERKRLADMMRYFAGSSASGLVSVRADDLRKAATLLEEPPRRHARKSLGRRFVLRFEDGEISTRTHYDLHSAEVCASAAGAEIIECDLVPVEEEKP